MINKKLLAFQVALAFGLLTWGLRAWAESVMIMDYVDLVPGAVAGGGAFSTTFASDSFVTTNNGDLSTHTADSGQGWIRRSGSAHAVNGDGLNHVYANGGSSENYYVFKATPTGTDYQVDWYHKKHGSANTSLYIGIRASSSVNTEYMATIDGTTAKILRSVNGVENGTILVSSSNAAFDFSVTPAHCQFDATGTSSVQLNFTINGVVVCSTADTNANRIQTKGFPMITHYYSDNFTDSYVSTMTCKQ